tara:strand:- start:309 stop:1376 length:1068 start_codon:yes stop_codon:yes gene_type:complete
MISQSPLQEKTLFERFELEEQEFINIIQIRNLDSVVKENLGIIQSFRDTLSLALLRAYKNNKNCERTHLFIQRILYFINRLKIFWYDKLTNYINEDSLLIQEIKLEIESSWSAWENEQINREQIKYLNVETFLKERVEVDLNPLPDEDSLFLRNKISILGYKRLLAIASLDGLVEASQLSRTLGGVCTEVQLMLTKILWEEYGGGKVSHKHSSHFTHMLEECHMETKPEAYFNIVPWEVLANINHSYYLSEKKQNYLRYNGGLLYTEVSAPSAFLNYLKAGERIGLSKKATGYWDIHIKEDIRHGHWMLNDVALPLAEQYNDDAWQIIWGYDQQKFISSRAIRSIVKSIRKLNKF